MHSQFFNIMIKLSLLIVAGLTSVPLYANFQTTDFRVYCGEPNFNKSADQGILDGISSYFPDPSSQNVDTQGCLPKDKISKIESWAHNMAEELNTWGFPDNPSFSLTTDPETNQQYYRIYVFTLPKGKYASSVTDKGKSWIQVNVGFVESNSIMPEYFQFVAIAHELFHVVDAYTNLTKELANRGAKGSNKGIDWVREGMANAFAYKEANKIFPPYTSNEYKLPYGLRAYYNYKHTLQTKEKKPGYATSHFWLHIAELYNNGELKYLKKFLNDVPPDSDVNSDISGLNWYTWLKEGLKTEFDRSTGMVFANFLTEFSSWGSSRYKRTKFESGEWLRKGFGGCQEVKLNLMDNEKTIHIDLPSYTGACIKVVTQTKSGFWSNLSMDAKIKNFVPLESYSNNAEDNYELSIDGLYLGLSMSDGVVDPKIIGKRIKPWNCYGSEKSFAEKAKIPACLMEPRIDELKKKKEKNIAEWNIYDQKPSTGDTITSYYILSYVPDTTNVSYHSKAVNLEISIGIAQSKLNLNSPTGSGERKRVKAAASITPTPDNRPPAIGMSMSDLMTQSPMEMLSKGLLTGQIGNMIKLPAVGGKDGISMLSISINDEESDEPIENLMLVFKPEVPFGFTGKQKAILSGNSKKDPYKVYILKDKQKLIDVTFVKFDKESLIIKINGKFCIMDTQKIIQSRGKNLCTSEGSINGTISLPFGWRYDPKQTPKALRTAGMKEFERLKQNRLHSMGFPMGNIPSTESTPPSAFSSGQQNSSASSISSDCACSCEELFEFTKFKDEIKKSKQVKQIQASIPKLMQMANCKRKCKKAYKKCR